MSTAEHISMAGISDYRRDTRLGYLLGLLLMLSTQLSADGHGADSKPVTESDTPVVKLGRTPSKDYLGAQPAFAFADGRGLPAGSGTAPEGEALYQSECASCHGSQGQGGAALELVGDRTLLATEYPDKGISVYWPYAPPLFDYIQRAMPPNKPYSLTNDQTYAVIAHILFISGLITEQQRVDRALLSALVMPNSQGFNSLVSEHP